MATAGPSGCSKARPTRSSWTGLFGPGPDGGPGSIWKIDGVTGEVSLFANVMLDGIANPGPGLGNIAYDAVHGNSSSPIAAPA